MFPILTFSSSLLLLALGSEDGEGVVAEVSMAYGSAAFRQRLNDVFAALDVVIKTF